MSANRKGIFIAFEGIDGSGKSTQIRLLADYLRKMEVAFYTTMEPTDSPIGSMIHQIMTGRMHADPKVIAALFTADRLDHLLNEVNGIARRIDEGTTVIMDRYYLSSYAYQSVDLPLEWLIHANEPAKEIMRPDVNIFIDIEPELAMERISGNRFQKELFEEQSRLERVRRNYLDVFDRLQGEEQVVVIDGNRSQEAVAEDIRSTVMKYL
ncbi:Thymidylate kinase [Eubacterium plexicaudatum ASF492]|uniref:Thymidylate kinase n=1 Tax=Eubacterium plexicaudatum ASF492 TaxID=1235802 RepID=N2AD03_9FIRM|nr:Thymidylate kinase [Eubacterium plexicaudatum ASF492]